MKDKIKHYITLGLPPHAISKRLNIPLDVVETIVTNNIGRPSVKFKQRPWTYPNSYYISKFKQGYTVAKIAQELGASPSTIYKLIKKRGICKEAYAKIKEEN